MAQVPKYADGGKASSAKNVEEYNQQKQELSDEYNKREQEAKTVLVNGKRYNISEAKDKLTNWVNSGDAKEIFRSYKKSGREKAQSSYLGFIDALDKGLINEVTSTPEGFSFTFNDGTQGLNYTDKYSKDYLDRAFKDNLLGLSEYSNKLETPGKVDASWNPQQMMESSVWGGKINQDLYNKKSTSERIDDVIKLLESNRGKFYEYLNAEDKTPFKGFENLPFKDINEYDKFIEDLSFSRDGGPQSEFDWEEQKQNQQFGSYLWKYVFGDQQPQQGQQSTQGGITPELAKKEENEIRAANGLKENAPLRFKYDGKDIVVTKEGLRMLNADGSLSTLRGYFNFQSNPETYQIPTGWYDDKFISEEELQNYNTSNPDFYNNIYRPQIEGWRTDLNKIDYGEADSRKGGYYLYNQLNKIFPLEGKYKVDYLSDYIKDKATNDKYDILGIFNEDSINSQLSSGKPAQANKMFAIDKETGMVTPVTGGYDKGFYYLYPEGETDEAIRNINRIPTGSLLPKRNNPAAESAKDLNKFLKGLLNKYFKSEAPLSPEVRIPQGSGVGTVIPYFQQGGIIRTDLATLPTQEAATMGDVFSGTELSSADKADLAALAMDVTGLASTAVVGIGNAVGAATGLGSTIATAIADYKRDDEWSWGDTGRLLLNLGMDAATVVPGLGSVAKGAKVLKAIKKAAPILKTAFIGAGITTALSPLNKAISGEDLTIDDWRRLATGLTSVVGAGRQLAGKKYTTKVEDTKPLNVSANGKSYEVKFTNEEARNFNSFSSADKLKAVKTKLKDTLKDGISPEDLDAITLKDFKWYNPKTYRSPKVKEVSKGRELSQTTLDNLREGKYGWFKRGLIGEQIAYSKPKAQEAMVKQVEDLTPVVSDKSTSTQKYVLGDALNPTIQTLTKKHILTKSAEPVKPTKAPETPIEPVKPKGVKTPSTERSEGYKSENEKLSSTKESPKGKRSVVSPKVKKDLLNKKINRRGKVKEEYNKAKEEILSKYGAKSGTKSLDIDKWVELKDALRVLDSKYSNKILKAKNGGVLKLATGGPFEGGVFEDNKDMFNYAKSKMAPPTKSTGITGAGGNVTESMSSGGFNMSGVPMSQANSAISAIMNTITNEKIYKLLKKKLRPLMLDSPTEFGYDIKGNEGLRQSYYKKANELQRLTSKPLTSDASRQLAFNLDVGNKAAELRLQGDLANAETIQQSGDKALQMMMSNTMRREDIAAKNQASVTDFLNKLAYLKAGKIAKQAGIADTFLHDINEQNKQYFNTMNQKNVQEELLDIQKKSVGKYSRDLNDISKKQSEIVKKYSGNYSEAALDPEYINLVDQAKRIQERQYKDQIDLQKKSLQGQYPLVFKLGGKL